MSKKMKVITVMLAILVCSIAVCNVSKAETINFNVTVNQNTMNKDPMSRKAKKADGETNFYVTPTYFSCTASVKVRSVHASNIKECSSWAYVYSDNVNVTTVNPYNRSVKTGDYYYMQSFYGSGKSSEVNMRGRYTP